MTYNIKITRPSPSMSQDKTVFEAADYAAAVKVAHNAFMLTRRAVVLCSGENGVHFYHRIDAAGVAVDRNTNSGIAPVQNLLTAEVK